MKGLGASCQTPANDGIPCEENPTHNFFDQSLPVGAAAGKRY